MPRIEVVSALRARHHRAARRADIGRQRAGLQAEMRVKGLPGKESWIRVLSCTGYAMEGTKGWTHAIPAR